MSLFSRDDLADFDAMQTLFETGSQDAAEFGATLAAPAAAGRYDELRGGTAQLGTAALAPAWGEFFTQVGSAGLADLDRRLGVLQRRMRENGLVHQLHEPSRGGEAVRPWSLDLLPLIVTPQDWHVIERGVLQRTRLLNEILRDVYGGEQRVLEQGLLPPALVTGHPGYLRPMRGTHALGDTWLHIAAFDLARAPDGAWHVMAQHTQGPSGLGYLLENRLIVSSLFPRAFRGLHVQRLAASYRALLRSLQTLSPAGKNARIVLLTPGPHASTYFEHAYLARYLGLTLVEGGDLTARDNRVFLKTLSGLEPVHGILRRVDDAWLDPLELRPDSMLGVPGLLHAVRAGNVLLANMPGSGFLESPAVFGFMPGLAEGLLGETLELPAVPSWWCGEAAACEAALPNLARSVIKPTYPQPGGQPFEPVLGARLSQQQLAEWRARIAARPGDYTVQEDVPLSQAPTWPGLDGREYEAGARIVPRPMLLRVYALSDGAGSWRVLPGGLARVGTRAELFNAPMPRGGSAVDTWVMTDGDVDSDTLLQTHLGPDDLVARQRMISSRAAENLFWLGRYTERAGNLARLARAALERLRGEDDVESVAHLQLLDVLCQDYGLLQSDTPSAVQAPRAFQQALTRALTYRAERGSGIAACLFGMRGAAAAIRERLSREQWRLIDEATQLFQARPGDEESEDQLGNDALQMLDRLGRILTAITGAQADHMTRDDGWRLLSVGRCIERLEFLSSVLTYAFEDGAVHKQDGFELVLEIFDSAITFRSQFQRCFDVAPLLALIVLDTDNPHSLAWAVEKMRARLSKVERGEGYALSELAEGLPNIAGWSLHALCEGDPEHGYPVLIEHLQGAHQAVWELANRIGERYFSHVREAGRSLWG